MRTMSRFALLAVVALGLACTKTNPRYCGDGGYIGKDCTRPRDAGVDLPHDAAADAGETADATDVAEASADVTTDATDTSAEKGPVCSSDDQCTGTADGGTPACGTADGGVAACVECTMDKHCTGTKAICDTAKQQCVECTGTDSMDCKGKPGTVCIAATQTCVECTSNAQCTGTATKPICDTSSHTCRPCALDSECTAAPGVCVDWDGHCATTAEVVTVQGGASCVPSPATGQFCRTDQALAAKPNSGVIIVKGPDPVATIEPLGGSLGDKLLIVGRGGAVVAAGAGDVAGIHLGNPRTYYVRDLKVAGGTIGILAEGMTDVHITRCVVVLNPKGGIKTSTASFDITNTVVSGNGPGVDTGGVAWGGVRLGDLPPGTSGRFANNTVVDNSSIGVSCTSSTYDVSTSIVHGNQGGDSIGCSGGACCGGNVDPKIDASFHLMSGSPCIDQIAATASTVKLDIDQQARPTPPTTAKLDCGADEFFP
jgi:hypothetical protein